jgi:hypothetical protein
LIREPRGKDPFNKQPTQVWGVSINSTTMAGIEKNGLQQQLHGITGPQMLTDPPHDHKIDEILFPHSRPITRTGLPSAPKWKLLSVKTGNGTPSTRRGICLPAGTSHCPVYMKKVDKRVYWGHIVPEYAYGYVGCRDTGSGVVRATIQRI